VSSEREIEAKLRVRSDAPEAVFARIASLRRLAGMALREVGSRRQRDLYWDTPAGALRARRAGLRLRWIGDAALPLLALKRDDAERGAEPGVIARSEWEVAWSQPAAAELARRLGALGASPAAGAGAGADAPEAALRALGLEPLQERVTLRRALHALDPGGTPALELALDRVEFRLAARALLHFEVELEALAPDVGPAQTAALARALCREIGPELAPWSCNKLVLGQVLAELLATPGALALRASGAPDEASYARVAAAAEERFGR